MNRLLNGRVGWLQPARATAIHVVKSRSRQLSSSAAPRKVALIGLGLIPAGVAAAWLYKSSNHTKQDAPSSYSEWLDDEEVSRAGASARYELRTRVGSATCLSQ